MANIIIAGNTHIELTDNQMATVLAVVRSMSIQAVQTTTQSSTTAPAPEAPVHEPKVYEHVSDSFSNFRFVLKDNTVTYTHADDKGTYLHEKAVRSALNARIKANGGTWDGDAKAWTFTKNGKRDIKGAKDFVANNSHAVSADELNAIRDKWTEKSAKRAGKTTK